MEAQVETATKNLGPAPLAARTFLEYRGARREGSGVLYVWRRGLQVITCRVEGHQHSWSEQGTLGYVVPSGEMVRALLEVL